MRRLICIALAATLTVLLASPVSGDTIYLTNGNKIKGKIVSETSSEIVVRKGSIKFTVKRETIRKIVHSSKTHPSKKTGRSVPKGDSGSLISEGRAHLGAQRFSAAAKCFRRARTILGKSDEMDDLVSLSESLATAKKMIARKFLKEAKDSANIALGIDPKSEPALKVMKRLERFDKIIRDQGSLPGKPMIRKTRHFDVHHNQPYIASKVARHAEECIKFLLKALSCKGYKMPRLKKIHIRVWRNHAEYKANTGPMGQRFPSLCTGPTEIVTYQGIAMGALKHEITHTVVHAFFPSMPVWIQEGFATGAYTRGTTKTYTYAKSFIKSKRYVPFDDFLKIKSMAETDMNPTDFYAQSRLAMEFLIHGCGGMRKFHKFARGIQRQWLRDKAAFVKGKRGKIIMRKVDFLEQPTRQYLDSVYGYDNLVVFDQDLSNYMDHRAVEAPRQARDQLRKYKPNWPYTAKYETEHFVMFTTSKKKLSMNLLDLAETTFDTISYEFWDAGILMPGKTIIYLFDKKKHYRDYMERRGIKMQYGTHLIPQFNGAACVYREGISTDWLYQATAHEVTHALTVSVMNTFSRRGCWLVEGIAHYIGVTVYANKKTIKLGEVFQTRLSKTADYLRILYKQNKDVPLDKFIDYNFQAIRTVSRHVQCFGLFHYMQHGENGKYRKNFHKYMAEACRTGDGGLDAFEKHVGKITLIDMQMKMYAADLKICKKKRRKNR